MSTNRKLNKTPKANNEMEYNINRTIYYILSYLYYM